MEFLIAKTERMLPSSHSKNKNTERIKKKEDIRSHRMKYQRKKEVAFQFVAGIES